MENIELAVDWAVEPVKKRGRRAAVKEAAPAEREGRIVYVSPVAMGFVAEGVNYQAPAKSDCKIGDTIRFVLTEGKVVLCE